MCVYPFLVAGKDILCMYPLLLCLRDLFVEQGKPVSAGEWQFERLHLQSDLEGTSWKTSSFSPDGVPQHPFFSCARKAIR